MKYVVIYKDDQGTKYEWAATLEHGLWVRDNLRLKGVEATLYELIIV